MVNNKLYDNDNNFSCSGPIVDAVEGSRETQKFLYFPGTEVGKVGGGHERFSLLGFSGG